MHLVSCCTDGEDAGGDRRQRDEAPCGSPRGCAGGNRRRESEVFGEGGRKSECRSRGGGSDRSEGPGGGGGSHRGALQSLNTSRRHGRSSGSEVEVPGTGRRCAGGGNRDHGRTDSGGRHGEVDRAVRGDRRGGSNDGVDGSRHGRISVSAVDHDAGSLHSLLTHDAIGEDVGRAAVRRTVGAEDSAAAGTTALAARLGTADLSILYTREAVGAHGWLEG